MPRLKRLRSIDESPMESIERHAKSKAFRKGMKGRSHLGQAISEGKWTTIKPSKGLYGGLEHQRDVSGFLEQWGALPEIGSGFGKVPEAIYTGDPYYVGRELVNPEGTALERLMDYSEKVEQQRQSPYLKSKFAVRTKPQNIEGDILSREEWKTDRLKSIFDPKLKKDLPSPYDQSLRNFGLGHKALGPFRKEVTPGRVDFHSGIGAKTYSSMFLERLGFTEENMARLPSTDVAMQTTLEEFQDYAKANWMIKVPRSEFDISKMKQYGLYMGGTTKDLRFMTPEQQADFLKRTYDQTRYLADVKTGKPFILGSRPIGIAPEVSPVEDLLSGVRHFAQQPDPVKSVLSARKKALAWSKSADPIKRQFGRDIIHGLSEVTGMKPRTLARKDFRLARNMFNKIKNDKNILEWQKEILSNVDILKKDFLDPQIKFVSGFEPSKELVENLREGTRVVAKTKRGIVPLETRLITPEELHGTILGPKAKTGTLYSKYAEGFMGKVSPYAYAPESVPIRFIRSPGEFGGIHQPWATQVVTQEGSRLGWLGKDYAQKFAEATRTTHIEKGMLEDVTSYKARIFGTKYGWQAWMLEGDKGYIPYKELKAAGATRLAGPMFHQEAMDATMRRAAAAKTGISGAVISKATDETVKSAGAAKGMGTMKGAMVGASLAIGAMLLLSATRSRKNQPLDERDIPQSMYGDSRLSPKFQDGQATHVPPARITQDNRSSAYSYNVSVDAEDKGEMTNYSDIANIMANSSRNALGVSRASVNLNVNDSSINMNPHTMQRRFSEYLRR